MTEVPIASPDVGQRAVDRVTDLLERGELAAGTEVSAFESAFADRCGVTEAVATSNGTTALRTALHACGLSEGGTVITSPFSFVASANAIRLAGGRPVFADIDPETLTIDPEKVRAILEKRSDVVGILPVHLYGLPAPMTEICEIAAEYDCFIVEDACQAHGAAIDGTPVGSFGDAGCFSFYPTKNLTTGEGGMVTTNRSDIAARARSFIDHGRTDAGRYAHESLGTNHRMTDLAAAVGRSQLERLESFTEYRRANAAYYDEHLADLPVETPSVPDGYRHVYHQYTIRTDDRDGLKGTLNDREIGARVYYPTPITDLPAYESLHTAATAVPVAERAADRVLSIPVHPAVSDDDRRRVVDVITDQFRTATDPVVSE